MLTSIAALNCFALGAFALLVAVRYTARERAYTEACVVTYILVLFNLLLKLGDAALPVALTLQCFPESAVLNFNTSLVSTNCVRPCMVGDLYAVYAFYAFGKTAVGAADVVLSTGFLVRRPMDWYRLKSANYASERPKRAEKSRWRERLRSMSRSSSSS